MTPLQSLADSVEALTRSRTHREPYTQQVGISLVHQHHVTNVPSLLDQLQAAVEPSGGTSAGHRVPGSTPACRLEALDALLDIDHEATQWIAVLNGAERSSLSATLRQLVGMSGDLDADDAERLASNARRWVTMAAVTTGWETPAWQPDNTCPLCETRRSLRVRVGDGYANALCVQCRATWDWETVGLLAEHIRAENADAPYDDGTSSSWEATA